MRLSTYFLGVPVVVAAAAVAVANRQSVVFSLDPFSPGASALSFSAPLFLLLFVAVAAGVLLGGVTAALSRRKQRKPQEGASAGQGDKGGKNHLPMRLGGSKPPKE